jgi:Prolyl oligopeptidase, N-terminal beta-propeller domain
MHTRTGVTPIDVASGRYFVWARTPKDELAILTVREGVTAEARVLLDPNPLSPDRTTQAGLESVSRDGRLIVYSIRRSDADAGRHTNGDAKHDRRGLRARRRRRKLAPTFAAPARVDGR